MAYLCRGVSVIPHIEIATKCIFRGKCREFLCEIGKKRQIYEKRL